MATRNAVPLSGCSEFFLEMDRRGERDPFWHSFAAGAVLLRGAEIVMAGETLGTDHLARIERRIQKVSYIPARRRFRRIYEAICAAQSERTRPALRTAVAVHLLDWAEALRDFGCPQVACEIFAAAANQVDGVYRIRTEALRAQGACLLQLGRHAQARIAYSALYDAAAREGDSAMMLRSRLFDAEALLAAGAIDEGEKELRTTIARAKRLHCGEVVGLGEINRAFLAGSVRKDHYRAVRHARRAIAHLGDFPKKRERALFNLAVSEREIGHAEASAVAARQIWSQSTDLEHRGLAALHLYLLAVDHREWDVAETLRAVAVALPLPAGLQAELAIVDTIRAATQGNAMAALAHLETVRMHAERDRQAHHAQWADTARAALQLGQIPARYDFRPEEWLLPSLRGVQDAAATAQDVARPAGTVGVRPVVIPNGAG